MIFEVIICVLYCFSESIAAAELTQVVKNWDFDESVHESSTGLGTYPTSWVEVPRTEFNSEGSVTSKHSMVHVNAQMHCCLWRQPLPAEMRITKLEARVKISRATLDGAGWYGNESPINFRLYNSSNRLFTYLANYYGTSNRQNSASYRYEVIPRGVFINVGVDLDITNATVLVVGSNGWEVDAEFDYVKVFAENITDTSQTVPQSSFTSESSTVPVSSVGGVVDSQSRTEIGTVSKGPISPPTSGGVHAEAYMISIIIGTIVAVICFTVVFSIAVWKQVKGLESKMLKREAENIEMRRFVAITVGSDISSSQTVSLPGPPTQSNDSSGKPRTNATEVTESETLIGLQAQRTNPFHHVEERSHHVDEESFHYEEEHSVISEVSGITRTVCSDSVKS